MSKIVIPPCRRVNQSITRININEDQSPRNQMMNTMIFYRGSLACRQASPRCGDSLTWRFTRQTLNRVPHNQHKMRITKAMSNSLEYLLALRRGKIKNPSQSPRSEPETITTLRSTILAALSHLVAATTKSNKPNPQRNMNTKCL